MKNFMLKNNWFIILGVALLMLSSCESSEFSDGSDSSVPGNIPFRLEIGSVGTRDTQDNDARGYTEVNEKIRSLRIVMLSDGYIELNEYIDMNASSGKAVDAESFNYVKERATVAGNKRFYLFANEESVESINFQISELPDALDNGIALSDFFKQYPAENLPSNGTIGKASGGKASEFERLMAAIYVAPEYAVEQNTVFLPYSAYYDGGKVENTGETEVRKKMYLVPMAAKFTLNLRNYRKGAVKVEKVELSQFNTTNFLLARISEEDQTQYFNSTPFYWIDWLAQVGKESQTAPDQDVFDKSVGWIQNYQLPGNAFIQPSFTLFTNNGIINRLVDKNNPETLKLVLYYPESRNMVKKTVYNPETLQYEEIDAQGYYARFRVSEAANSENVLATDWIEIDKVQALFRNTHVVVDVDLHENLVEIYSEVSPWKESDPVNGFVTEKDDD